MKTVKFIFSAFVGIIALACAKEERVNDEATTDVQKDQQYMTFTCTIPESDSKVSIADDGKNTWTLGDTFFIHGQYKGTKDTKLYSTEVTLDGVTNTISQDGKTAYITIPELVPYDMTGSGYKSNLYIAYPADAVKDISEGTELRYINYFKNTNRPLMSGYNPGGGTNFVFVNLCSVISFKVNSDVDVDSYEFYGNSGETLGYTSYNVKVVDPMSATRYAYDGTSGAQTSLSGPVTPGETCYIYIPNGLSGQTSFDEGVTFSNGFTIELKKNGSPLKMASTKGEIELTRNMLLPLDNITTNLKPADLSKMEPANCYMVSYPSTYRFQAVQGNTRTSVGTVHHARILWQSYNDNTAPATISATPVITEASYANGYISFTIPDPVVPGNAVIVAEDSSDKILWSWHIWVPATTVTSGTYGISSREMMDRNLGALVVAGTGDVRANGLLYQWGRKDPFLGQGAYGSSTIATYYSSQNSFSVSTAAFASISESISKPMEFAISTGHVHTDQVNYADKGDMDWLVTTDASRWGANKTIYDPCPPGWKVPSSSECVIFNSSTKPHALDPAKWVYDSSDKKYIRVVDALFPLTGRRKYTNGSLEYRETRADVWSASSSSVGEQYEGCATWMEVTATDASNHYSERKARGASVRCVKE